jgi:hypothetical protein
VLRPIVAIAIAGLVASAAASPTGAGQRAKLRCEFAKRDRVCLLKPVFGVTPDGSGKIRRLKPGSTVDVKRKGKATVFLAREAQCQLLGRGKRTTIQTRTPNPVLFSQVRGETLCIMDGDTQIFIKGQVAGARTTSATKFAALLTSKDGNEPVQARIRYRLKSSVGIALRRGGISVLLSTGRELDLGEGDEMLAGLTSRGTIKPRSLHVAEAHFDSVEKGFWGSEGRSWFQLSVETAGSGSGIVVSNPAGIDCADDCNESYAQGTLVTLTARPDDTSEFVGWSDGCSGAKSRCTVTMNDARFVTAIFAAPGRSTTRVGLTVTEAGAGTVTSSPAGIDCGSTCSWQYDSDSVVTLTASPDPGSRFAGWSGACATTAVQCLVTMDGARSVTATFVRQFQLTVMKVGYGTVTSDVPGIDCGSVCVASYDAGTIVTLAATSDYPYYFDDGWSGDCGPVTCTLAMYGTKNVTATFFYSD